VKRLRHVSVFNAIVLLLGTTFTASALAQSQKPLQDEAAGRIVVGTSYQNDTSLPLYYLPEWKDGVSEDDRDAAENPKIPNHHVDSVDPVVQHTFSAVAQMPLPILNFDGMPNGCGCAPPDTDGEVGETQYVQMTNAGYQVFNKATGVSVLGPVSTSSIWAGFGGVCETNGHGDPVVLYDQIAKRWVISQFASATANITDECIAVSTTSDATGSYNRYGFHLGSNFYDYPHLGMWPDGYYMSMNVFNASGTAYLGPQPYAFNRTAMLTGAPATFLSTAAPLGNTFGPLLPADLDGSATPPIGSPNPFVEFPGQASPVYNVYRFHADFATPANTTFALASSPAAAAFTELCGSTRACVPQIGGVSTDNLDGIGDRLMFRLAYRNFGAHDALVGNFTVSAGGVAGIRWFELRNTTSGATSVFQESTYQPDTTWRWMGSTAMDVNGDLALAYSASNGTINPQLRYAGRLSGDPLNTLSQAEVHLFDGTGHQTGTSNRWGDYSDLSVDPVDECTFWFTSEYYSTTGAFGWKTRIGNFKFPSCSLAPGFSLAVTPSNNSVCAGTPANYSVSVGSTSGFNGAVTLAATGNPASSTVSFTPNPVPTLPGTSALQVVTTGVAAGSYPLTINGTATGASNQSASTNLAVFAGVPGAPTLTAPANASTGQAVRPTFTWTGSNTESYKIDVATDSAFSSIILTQTLVGTTFTPAADLSSNATFYWRVTPTNPCGSGVASPTFTFATQALPGDCTVGTTPQTVYSYDFESGLNGWTLGAGSIGNTWADNLASFHGGAHSWKATDSAVISDQRFVSPSIVLPSGQLPLTLQFWHKRDLEPNTATSCYDGGILEASTNAGATWTQVNSAALLTDPYTGPVSSGFTNPLAGLQAWCGVQDWTREIVDVAGYAGQTAQFRFRLGSDSSVGHDGWYLDDVKVQSCLGGPTYTVGGNVSGLAASGLVLSLNSGAQTLPVPVSGAFTFPNGLPTSTPYAVTVGTQPAGQTCSVANGSGTIAGANVTNVAVTCVTTPTYTVGGSVSGLSGTGLVLSLNAGAQTLPIAANGTFTFPTALADGTAYAVTVGTQPSGPSQTCTVSNGSGTLAGANVSNVAVTCTTNSYTVGGSVSGLVGSGLVLTLNGSTNLPVGANGTFAFPGALASGTAYTVTVSTQPTSPVETCTVTNNSGTIAAANVTNVAVSCSDAIFTDGFDG
jgi:hypothetical protein